MFMRPPRPKLSAFVGGNVLVFRAAEAPNPAALGVACAEHQDKACEQKDLLRKVVERFVARLESVDLSESGS
jgi:hypothetical protein